MKLEIDYSKDSLLDEFSLRTLEERYMVGDEKSPQEAFARAAEAFADDEAHAQRLYDYVSKQWFMFATPLLSNGGTQRGLPISCFLNYVDDSREGITEHYTENAYLSSFGGGIGGSWSSIRAQGTKTSKGSESTGVIPFMKVVDAEMLAFSQGVTRRGDLKKAKADACPHRHLGSRQDRAASDPRAQPDEQAPQRAKVPH